MDEVTFPWHRILSLYLVTGADTHTLDMLTLKNHIERSQWKIPSWQCSPQHQKQSHWPQSCFQACAVLTLSPALSVQYIVTFNSSLKWVLCWSRSVSSLLIYQCLCIMASNANQRYVHVPKWTQRPAGDILKFRTTSLLFLQKLWVSKSVKYVCILITKKKNNKKPTFPFDSSQSTHRTKTMLSHSNSNIF